MGSWLGLSLCPSRGSTHVSFVMANSGSLDSSQVSLAAQLVKNPSARKETAVELLGWEDPLKKGQAAHSSILGLPLWLSWWRICLQCGRPGFDPWVGKIPWRVHGNSLQYSFLENPHGQRSLAGCSPQAGEGSNVTQKLSKAQTILNSAFSSCLSVTAASLLPSDFSGVSPHPTV